MSDPLHKLELFCYLIGVLSIFPGAFVMGMEWAEKKMRNSKDSQ